MHKNFEDLFPGIFSFLHGEEDTKKHYAVDMFVYLYIAYHYCMSEDDCISITYQEIREGCPVDNGTGFSYSSIAESIKRLRQMGLLLTKKRRRKGASNSFAYRQEFTPLCTYTMDTIAPFKTHSSIHNYEDQRIILNNQTFFQQEVVTSDLPLFAQKNSKKRSSNKPNKYQLAASKFYSKVASLNLDDPKSSPKQWTACFRKELASRDWEEVTEVLNWYIANIHRIMNGPDHDKYMPIARSASTFVKKYQSIKLKMMKDQQEHREEEMPEPPRIDELTEEDRQKDRDSAAYRL